MAKKLAHIFLFDAVTINQFYYGVWAQKSDRRVEFNTPEFCAETARLCERGKLDGIFFADLAAGPNTHRDSYDPAGRDGAFFPAYDPLLAAGIIAAKTADLGIIVTTPAEVDDEIESWLDDDGLDAINLRQWQCFDTLTEFVELVVPELQRRGRFRSSYAPGETLRERLFDSGPWVGPEHPAHRYRNALSAVPN